MKTFLLLIILALTMAIGLITYLSMNISNAAVEVQSTPSQNTGSLKVVPNYGEQKTAPGSYLQPANVCLQNCK